MMWWWPNMELDEAIKLAEKAIKRRKDRLERYMNRPLRSLSGAELWNEFSNSNVKLPT
jgi:hypothetical protein